MHTFAGPATKRCSSTVIGRSQAQTSHRMGVLSLAAAQGGEDLQQHHA
jgi:hypothetical protein